MRFRIPLTVVGVLVLAASTGCSKRLYLDYRAELLGTKAWAETTGERITVVVRLPHPEGVQPPRVVSLDEPFDFERREEPTATEVRFPILPARLGPKKQIRLSVDFGGSPSILILEGPVLTTGQATIRIIVQTVVSSLH